MCKNFKDVKPEFASSPLDKLNVLVSKISIDTETKPKRIETVSANQSKVQLKPMLSVTDQSATDQWNAEQVKTAEIKFCQKY